MAGKAVRSPALRPTAAGLMAAMLLLAFGPTVPPLTASTAAATTTTVAVPATGQWVDTGVSVGAGDMISVTATGSWSPGAPELGYVGPDGSNISWGDNFLNLTDIGKCTFCAGTLTAHWAALIGYIGSNPPPVGSYANTTTWIAEGAKVFFVGSDSTTTSIYSGSLWLAFNDDAYSANTSDNSGEVTATASNAQGSAGGPRRGPNSAGFGTALQLLKLIVTFYLQQPFVQEASNFAQRSLLGSACGLVLTAPQPSYGGMQLCAGLIHGSIARAEHTTLTGAQKQTIAEIKALLKQFQGAW